MTNVKLFAPINQSVVLTTLFVYIRATTKPACDIRLDPTRGLTADCSDRKLSSVPHDIPANIVIIDLHRNSIEHLHSYDFSNFTMLESLDLSDNIIPTLKTGVFNGLGSLLDLDLRHNYLHADNGSFPLDIFGSLVKLKNLYLTYNLATRQQHTFPDYIFHPLTNLLRLEMDLWPRDGPTLGLASLISLRYLHVDSKTPTKLLNTTFSSLQSSRINNVSLFGQFYGMDICVFCPMVHLTELNIKTYFNSYITLRDATTSFYAFRRFNMTSINLAGIQINRMTRRSAILTKAVFGYLSSVCLKRLDLSNNEITGISMNLLQPEDILWSCLTHIDLSHNLFMSFPVQVLLKISLVMINLEFLDLSHNFYKFKNSPVSLNNITIGLPVDKFSIPFPPKLRFANFSGSINDLGFRYPTHIVHGEHMRVLDLSSNGQLTGSGTVTGLAGIVHLNISCMIVDESILLGADALHNVETFIAADIVPIPDFLQVNSIFFTKILKVKVLDLSGDKLQTAVTGTFSKLLQLENLIVARNRFNNVPREFLAIPSLHLLDLSSNIISVIPPLERGQLDSMVEQRKFLSLNLKGNSFLCTCATLDFIVWLQETDVSLDNKGNYSCLSEDGNRTDTAKVYQDMLFHWRHCIAQFWFTLTSILTAILVIGMMSAFLLQKYYSQLEFHVLHMLGYNTKKLKTRADCMFDAYVYYGEDVYPGLCQNTVDRLTGLDDSLRLFTNANILAGRSILHDFPDNISKCWKLVVVVTEALFDDNSVVTIVVEAATQFSMDGVLSDRILLVYEDDSPAARAQIPRVLLNVVPEENSIDMRDDDGFWRELLGMIQTDKCGLGIVF